MSDNPPSRPTTPLQPTVAQTEAADIDPRLVEILDEYFEQLQSSQDPDAEAFLAKHNDLPGELQDELRACIEGMQHVHTVSPAGALSELGDFRIVREVGRGGMGVVYEAEQLSLKRRVALKVMRYAVADPAAMTRFRREAETVAKLHHSNIVPIFAVGEADGVNYFAMQFIDGQSLADVQRSADEPLDSLDIADWGLQAAEALAYAHEHEIIHRDVKPSNLILDPEGRVWLTDFGLAKRLDDVKLSMTGAILGTPRYMSPEQASSVRKPVDHRTDIYSLGATLYELATNKPLFDAESPHVALGQIITAEPVAPRLIRPKLPRDLETIILRCLSKDATHRYESATELVEDLRAFIDGRAINARRPSWAEQLGRWLQKHQRMVTTAATAAGVAAALIFGVSMSLHSYRQSKLGRLQFDSLRDLSAPLVADVLHEDGTPAIPSFTIPTQQPIEIPEGDYELQLHSAGTMSDSYHFSVTPSKNRVEIRTNLEDKNVWPPTQVDGPWIPWQRPDGTDFVVFDKQGITLLDGKTSDKIWKSNLHEQKEWFRDRHLLPSSWDWWNPHGNSLKSTEGHAFGYARIATDPVDCNADGTDDLVLAFRFRPIILAISGRDGTPLWCQVGRIGDKVDRRLHGTVWEAPIVTHVDDDGVADLIASYGIEGRADDGRTITMGIVHALSGSTGESIWKYEIDPKLHNTNKMPYAPFSARWYHEPFMGIEPTASEGLNDVWAYEESGISESRNNHEGDWVPYGPALDPTSQGKEIVLFAGKQRLNLDIRSGKLVSSGPLNDTPVRMPQWIEETQQFLVCTRILPNKNATGSAKKRTALRVALWDSAWIKPIWQIDVAADWEWQIDFDEITRKLRKWPLIEDLDGDGVNEVILPADSAASTDAWREVPKGKIQVLDIKTGKPKLVSESITNMAGQLNHFAVADDVDGDGIRDIAVVSQFAGPEVGRSDRDATRLYIYVDVLSGKDGRQLRRMQSRPTEIEHGHRTNIKRIEELDGSLLVEVTRSEHFDGSRDQLLMFDLYRGRLASSTDRVQQPQLLDLDRNATRELVCWSAKDRSEIRSGGRLSAYRVSRDTSAQWKYLDQHLVGVPDVDGDGIGDALQIPPAPNGREIAMVSGATGRSIWKHRYRASGTIHVYPAQSDFDGDGSDDILVGQFSPQIKKQKPLGAISGRTGKKLWSYSTQGARSWNHQRFLETTDLDGDSFDEILFLVEGTSAQEFNRSPSSERAAHLYCIGSNGHICWRTQLTGKLSNAHGIRESFGYHTADVNGDDVKDIVGVMENAKTADLRVQTWSGKDGQPLWEANSGRLNESIGLRETRNYPHLNVLPSSRRPQVVAVTGRDAFDVTAYDSATGEPRWHWNDQTWFSQKVGFNEQRRYGNPVPLSVRTPSGTHLGFWYLKSHPSHDGRHPDQQSCDFVLLDADGGEEVDRVELIRQKEFVERDFSLTRAWAIDLNGDEFDEIVISIPSAVVAYSLATSEPLWQFPIPAEKYRILSVGPASHGEVEVRVLIRDADGKATELLAINAMGNLVWSHSFPNTLDTMSYGTDWLDVLETNETNRAPHLLCRSPRDNATSCRLAVLAGNAIELTPTRFDASGFNRSQTG